MLSNGQIFTLLSTVMQENNLLRSTAMEESNLDDQKCREDLSSEDEECDSYSCKVCYNEFRTLIELQRHYIKHIVNKPFQCQKCDKSYFKATALEKHNTFHNTLKPFDCKLCDDRFLTKSKLEAHMDTHYIPQFSCNACFACFPTKKILHKHERSHTTLLVDSLLYFCSLCDNQYFYQHELESHMSEHEMIQLNTCEECNKTFFFSYLLWKHKQEHIYKVICNICEKSFSDKYNLHEHEKSHLQEQLDMDGVICYVCELCSATFPFKAELETHYNDNHEGKHQFPCLMCCKSFFLSYLCGKHKSTHSEFNQAQCEICLKKMRNKVALKTHLLTHGMKEHECPFCEKKFTTKQRLQKHCTVHTNLKPYECSFCPAKFTTRNNLQRHFTVHMKEKEIICEKCNMCFTRRDGLNRHRKFHHLAVKCNVCNKTFMSQLKLSQHNRKEHASLSELKAKTLHPCDLCHKTMKSYSSYIIHRKRHSGERAHECLVCGKAFYQKIHMLTHLKYQHPEAEVELPFKCGYCNQQCISKRGLVLHQNKRHPNMVFKTR